MVNVYPDYIPKRYTEYQMEVQLQSLKHFVHS